MEYPNFIKSILTLITLLTFVACSTAPEGVISSSADPRREIAKLSNDLNAAQETNVDVLARKEYKKSLKFLKKAKKDLADGDDQEEVLDDLRFARQSLNQAISVAKSHQDDAPGLFESRQNAIQAGATQSSELKKELYEIDEDVADIVYKINKVSTKDVAQLQTRYVNLERKSVISIELGKATAQINGARNDKAKERAPNTLRKAQISLKNAESLIGSNVSNPSGYRQAVSKANSDANFLTNVMQVLKENGKSMTEASALRMVAQNRQISSLKGDLSMSEDSVSEAESEIDQKNQAIAEKESAIAEKNVALGAAQGSIAMQKAIEKSRQQFSNSDAEAYQQGDHLLIRLKSMNFKSGSSDLPSESIQLLVMVNEVAKSLNAKEIKIVGHTDSVGSRKLNKSLSEQRALAVATYFKENGVNGARVVSEGHGFEDPISTNKSKTGRAQNRRVDIIITPDDSVAVN